MHANAFIFSQSKNGLQSDNYDEAEYSDDFEEDDEDDDSDDGDDDNNDDDDNDDDEEGGVTNQSGQ